MVSKPKSKLKNASVKKACVKKAKAPKTRTYKKRTPKKAKDMTINLSKYFKKGSSKKVKSEGRSIAISKESRLIKQNKKLSNEIIKTEKISKLKSLQNKLFSAKMDQKIASEYAKKKPNFARIRKFEKAKK